VPNFTYRALNPAGEALEGTIPAPSRVQAVTAIREQGLVPLEIARETGRAKTVRKERSVQFGRPGSRELLIFTTQLATILRAGLTLANGLQVIVRQCENPKLREIVADVRERIVAGDSLSDALRRHPRLFSDLYCNMVRVGETTGNLAEVLHQLGKYVEMSQALRANVISSLAYPALIVVVGVVSVTLLMLFVVPSLVGTFTELNIELPALTRGVITLSTWALRLWWLPIALVITLYYVLRRLRSSEAGKYRLDVLRKRIPVLGPTLDKVHVARFSRTLGTLVSSGIPVVTGLELVSRTTGSAVLGRALRDTADQVKKGQGLAGPLEETDALPGMVCSLIGIGEESGRLNEMLAQVTEQYEMEVNIALKRLLSLFEPAVIIIMAVMVGSVVLAFLLPMLTISTQIE
jgi:type IV pilus assembly protein PilC